MEAKEQLREQARSVARGRREGMPFYLHTAVFAAVGAFAAILIGIAIAIWLTV